MKETIKQRQIATLIQKEFSYVLQTEGSMIYGDALVTVTRVRMSSDLGIAYIYVSVYNAQHKEQVVKELWENLSRLRGSLGKRIRKQVRRIPVIKFFIDDTLDQVEHLDSLFNQLDMGTSSGSGTRSMKEAMEAKNAASKKEVEEDFEGEDDFDGEENLDSEYFDEEDDFEEEDDFDGDDEEEEDKEDND